ncbi:MAG: DUF2784 domain-containing protein [Spirochaetes bacterium]|nr:DUF2784 domain-containing protein [Spirochaetota bacterium]
MAHWKLQLLDNFFLVFHTVFTLFNMTGWIFRRTRKLHAVTMALTAASWFILGIWYGWGYCFCTDWHWQVRELLGRPIGTSSYIHFLIIELTGLSPNPQMVDNVVLAVFLLCVVMTITLNVRDALSRRRDSASDTGHR